MTTYATNVVPSITPAQSPRTMAGTFAQALFGTEARVLVLIVALVALWGMAIVTWGYPALIIVALCLVPVMFTVMLLITVGK